MEITVNKVTGMLVGILKANAPKRGSPLPPSVRTQAQRINYMKPTKSSPYPGNLKNNGINFEISGNSSRIEIGGERAPYAEYTETRSMRKGWMAKSERALLNKLKAAGGVVR